MVHSKVTFQGKKIFSKDLQKLMRILSGSIFLWWSKKACAEYANGWLKEGA